jgi:hypothetical protein
VSALGHNQTFRTAIAMSALPSKADIAGTSPLRADRCPLAIAIIIGHPWLALRIYGLVIGSLFFVGYHWAKFIDANPWLASFGLTALGMALVVVAIIIGG